MNKRNYRWSDNDHNFGPFIHAKEKYRSLAAVLDSGDGDEYAGCRFRLSGFGHTLIVLLPPIIRPWRRRVVAASWDAATVARMGRNWYFDSHSREYGLSYSNGGSDNGGGFLQVFLGRQTGDSSTTQSWSCFTPWNNWRHVRTSYYGLQGEHYWTEPKTNWRLSSKEEHARACRDEWAMKEQCPTVAFAFDDFDGERLKATTRIEEREWKLGDKWCKWISLFRKPKIRREMHIGFSGETGRRKGSWKGGTTGHGIEMLPGELHESAFKRYCAEHEMTFRGGM